MSTMQKRNRLQTAMKLTSTANEVGFDAQRNRLRFFATSYSYSKHFIYAFNGRTRYIFLFTRLCSPPLSPKSLLVIQVVADSHTTNLILGWSEAQPFQNKSKARIKLDLGV